MLNDDILEEIEFEFLSLNKGKPSFKKKKFHNWSDLPPIWPKLGKILKNIIL